MGPCRACGYVGAPVDGYCPRCHAYRGAAGEPPGPANPVPAQAAQPARSAERRSTLPVLVVLVVALVAVVASIAGIVISRNIGASAARGGTGTPAASASPSPSRLSDTCLVGYWWETDYETTISFGGGQDVRVSGGGAHLSIAATGQFSMRWPEGKVAYRGEGSVGKVRATIEGDGRGRVEVTADHGFGMQFTTWDGTMTLYLDGKKVGSKPLDFSETGKSGSYTCDAEKLTVTGTAESRVFEKEGTATPAPRS